MAQSANFTPMTQFEIIPGNEYVYHGIWLVKFLRKRYQMYIFERIKDGLLLYISRYSLYTDITLNKKVANRN